MLAGDVLEFVMPSLGEFLQPATVDSEDPDGNEDDLLDRLRFFVCIRPRAALPGEDLTVYAVQELRRISAALADAADAIESGVSP